VSFIYVVIRLTEFKENIIVKSACSRRTVHLCHVALNSQHGNYCSGTSSLPMVEANICWD